MKIYPKAVLSLLIILLNFSCSKDDSIPTEKERPVDVYVVGSEYISQTTSYAKIWENDIPSELTSGNSIADATDVFVYGDDVYVVGYETSIDGKGIAKLWKNGEGTPLTDGKQSAWLDGISVVYR